MKKKYITIKEVLSLRNCEEKIYVSIDKDYYYKFVSGFLCQFDSLTDKLVAINIYLYDNEKPYILEPEDFKIEKTGLYKTRDGRNAFVSEIRDVEQNDYPVVGIINGRLDTSNWTINGKHVKLKDRAEDLVEYIGD